MASKVVNNESDFSSIGSTFIHLCIKKAIHKAIDFGCKTAIDIQNHVKDNMFKDKENPNNRNLYPLIEYTTFTIMIERGITI